MEKNAEGFELHVEIPANTTTIIYLPTIVMKNVTESNRPISNKKDVVAAIEKGKAKIKVGSGKYYFKIR